MDSLPLKDRSIFQEYSGQNFEQDGSGHNVMDFRDEIIYLWDHGSGCLLTQGVRAECSSHQELRPTEQPAFDVRYISINSTGTRAAAWGANGVAIIDLPQRFGPHLEFENGKKSIFVKLRNLDGLDLTLGTTVLQVRWNASSYLDSAFILLSNNTLSHFMLLPHDTSPIRSTRIGCRPSSRIRTLVALGETAVDFCYVPIKDNIDNSRLISVLLLRGNGDVVYIVGDVETDDLSNGQTLPISPLPDDNYLNDACSILALPGRPPGVIIATSRGVIYHSILVPLDTDQVMVPLRHRKYRLLVLESVVLDPGLQLTPDDFNSFPIQLIADPGHSRRYMAMHSAGVHSVVMEVLSGVYQLVRNKVRSESAHGDSIIELQADSSSLKMPESMIEYVVCCGQPLKGCVVYPYTFLALDAENRVIELPLRRIELVPFELYSPQGDNGDVESPLTSEIKKPFEQQIEQLIRDSRVLPRLRFPPQELSREQLLALAVRIGNLVRKETIPRYRQIRSILAQRVNIIRSTKELQLHEISGLEEKRADIQLSAETFSERVETIVEDLEEQRERVQALTRKIASIRPVASDAELRMDMTIGNIESKVQGYSDTLEKLKKSRAYQDMKIQEHNDNRQIALSNKQVSILRDSLSAIGENVSLLVRQVNELNGMLGLANE